MNIQQNAPLVYISFSAEINQKTSENLIRTLLECASFNVKEVCILFSCSGGNVVFGFNIYNILSNMPYKTTIHNVGQVDSMGTLVFLAAKQRYATSNSTFKFHGIGHNIQNQRLVEKDCKNYLASILNDQEKISKEYTKTTSLTEEEIANYFREEATISADEALEKGVIHEVKAPIIQPNCPVISFIF